MRRLLGVLSDEPGPKPLEPQPTLARLDELITRVEAAGIAVTIEIDGDPHSLSDGVQLAVFRVAQEALTNTLKHAARPTTAHLRLRCRSDAVDLEVIDTGTSGRDGSQQAASSVGPTAGGASPGALGAVPHTPAGRGIRGMRERATAYGGDIDAGPTEDGGWRVHVRLGADEAGNDR
jgi:signal transduction histidine kinase